MDPGFPVNAFGSSPHHPHQSVLFASAFLQEQASFCPMAAGPLQSQERSSRIYIPTLQKEKTNGPQWLHHNPRKGPD